MTSLADLDELAAALGHQFDRPALLRQALAHRSWVAEHDGEPSNERLEFLGDAVLGWAIADIVYRRYGHFHEGQLTDLRKSVVNAVALAEVAAEINLGAHILLGKGEAAAGGADKPSILSDAFEAVLGAVYLDGGAEAAFGVVDRCFSDRLPESADDLDHLDHKTMLQELLASAGRSAPEYRVSESGPDHAKTFHARVIVDGEAIGAGDGRSKKAAEQAAATEACAALG
ncbi:MAG: ribonuclease III [Actinomycetota bacterium]